MQWKGRARRDRSPPGLGRDHRVVHLPVLVAHRRRRRAGIVEEVVARRLFRRAFEVVALVEAVERRLDDAGILAGLDLLLQPVALGAAGDVDERRQPVEGGEHFVLDRARLDDGPASARPAARACRLPRCHLSALEGGDAAVGEGDGLGAVVGGEDDDGVVELAHVLQLLEDEPMLSSICFMPASLTPQSLPPGSPTMAMYLSDSTVVTCMRAGLYQTKNGLLVFLGSLRSRKSMTLAEISSSTVFERSSVSGPSSWHVWFFLRAVGGLAPEHRARGRQADRRLGVHGAGDLGEAGDRRVLARRRDALHGRGLVDVGEAHLLHRVEVVEVAPVFLEAVRRRQRRGVVAQVVLAELAGVVAEIEQELGERRRAGPQIGRAAGQLRRDHAGAQRMHAGEEGIAPGGAALLGDSSP